MTTSHSFGTSWSKGIPFRLASTFCALSAAFLASCGSPPPPANVHAVHAQDVTTAGVVAARGEDEALVLKKMTDLPISKATKVGNLIVQASLPYRSASGRNCRDLTLARPDGSVEPRLACTEHLPGRDPDENEAEGQKTWVFVPSVFIPLKEPVDPETPVSKELSDDSTEPVPATTPSPSTPLAEKDHAQ